MFHMRKLSNTRSTPVVFSSKPTKTRCDHEQWTLLYPWTDGCAARDITLTTDHTSSTAKPPKTSTKPFHRPAKVNVGRANSAKEFRGHLRTESEPRRDGVEPTKRHVHKHLITHPDCPWVESNGDQHVHTGYLAQHRPVRSSTRGSCESDETAVDDEVPTRVDAKGEGWATPPAKAVQDTLHPTVRLISKPLPDTPTFDPFSSRWSGSTGSVYSNDDPFPFDKILDMFPDPPKDALTMAHSDDLEDLNSLSTPPVFMSSPNHSSSSVATVTPETTLGIPTVRPLMLKAVPKPKAVVLVHQTPFASRSYVHLQDSIVIRRGRAYPQGSVEGSIHPPIRGTSAAPTLRQRSSSVTPPRNRNRPERPPNPVNIKALVMPYHYQTPEEIAEYDAAATKFEEEYQARMQLEDFGSDFGLNPWYKGQKRCLAGLALDRPDRAKQKRSRWWL